MRWTWAGQSQERAALLLLGVLACWALRPADAYCLETQCSGHGNCTISPTDYLPDGSNKCSCWDGFSGLTCSQRSCPAGNAWSDVAISTNTAHQLVECSNKGSCNYATGLCVCEPGFRGSACDKLDCPVDTDSQYCSGHGRCLTMSEAAAGYDGHHLLRASLSYTSVWDAHQILGCVCDEGWEGFDCSIPMACAFGDDPLTLTQVDEVQVLDCLCSGDCSFTLNFRGQITGTISGSDSEASLRSALKALSNIPDISVTIKTAGHSTICHSSGTSTEIRFSHNSGTHPPLIYVALSGSPTIALEVGGTSGSYAGGTSVTGTKEHLMCSGRGYCLGQACVCFLNFDSSDGAGGAGAFNDCGYFTGTVATADHCPVPYDSRMRAGGTTVDAGAVGERCWGHGQCGMDTGLLCVCDSGYSGRYCQHKMCPMGNAWFHEASADNSAHTYASGGQWECSNRGTCDHTQGKCICQSPFTGSACELMTCGSNTTAAACSDSGTCSNMAELAISGGTTYAAWDAEMIQGCACRSGFYHGPLEGDISDFIHYTCELRTCPTGDDPHTTGQVDEVQRVTCAASSGTFTLSFGGATTTDIPYNSAPSAIENALEALATIKGVTVTLKSGASHACDSSNSAYFDVTFTHNHGDLALMATTVTSGSISSAQEVLGTKEEAECSNRGICNRRSGRCKCFTGYCSSDGAVSIGRRGDCGYMPTGKLCDYSSIASWP